MPRRPLCILLALSGLLVPAPSASALQRWASATSVKTSGQCSSVQPCRIDYAVNSATPTDEVIVSPGTYTVSTALSLPSTTLMHGEDGQPRPVLVGDSSLTAATLSVDGATTVKHLRLEATGTGADALSVKGGALVEDVIAVSASGDGARVVSEPGGTTIRDSVAVSRATGAAKAALKLRDSLSGGGVVVRNVTAWAVQGASGIRCQTSVGSSSIVNTIARGTSYDVDAANAANSSGDNGDDVAGAAVCSASYSNARAAKSPGLTVSNGQQVDPVFFDSSTLDFRPRSTSPTIDAGTNAGSAGSVDPAGKPRSTGSAPDIGAYEYDAGATPPSGSAGGSGDAGTTRSDSPAADTTTTTSPATPARTTTTPPAITEAAPPELGRSVVLDAGTGTVKVKLPGASTFTTLGGAANLPTGTVVDTRAGVVTLQSALPGGKVQTGTFSGGLFEVRQAKSSDGMTDIVLRGGSFGGCAPVAKQRAAKARAASAPKRKRKKSAKRTVRRLWASDKGGRFRTHGHDSVATVRGTTWLTEDRCDGTLTRVVEGAVDVRDVHRKRTTRVRAGRSVLVRRAAR